MAEKKDFTKGRKYVAKINVSFGVERDMVLAGQTFFLDDEVVEKKLLADNAITSNLNFVEKINKSGGTDGGVPVVGAQKLPVGRTSGGKTLADLQREEREANAAAARTK